MQDDTNLDGLPVFIITGKVWVEEDGPEVGVHILLRAPDDDSAVREALNALSEDGYFSAEFDRIGSLTEAPDEEPHASAYQGALEGEVAIVAFDDAEEEFDDEDELGGDNVHPFAALKDWDKS